MTLCACESFVVNVVLCECMAHRRSEYVNVRVRMCLISASFVSISESVNRCHLSACEAVSDLLYQSNVGKGPVLTFPHMIKIIYTDPPIY